MVARNVRLLVPALLLAWSAVAPCLGQEKSAPDAKPEGKPEAKLPVIADEPKTIDPASLLPKLLTKLATCDLSNSSLAELIDWLREEQGIVVLLNKPSLADIGVLPSDPISDHLDNAPIYLLLNRLNALSLDWRFQDGIVHIATAEEIEDRLTTRPHNIGDLLDAGYQSDDLLDLIECVIRPTSWDNVGGAGALSSLGDVLFVRQTDHVQREVEGLLAALRKHGRMTFILDPPQHEVFRKKLKENVSVDFRDTPLETAVTSLAEKTALDIRLDRLALRELNVRERSPVTLTLADCRLETVLQAMLVDLDLTWILRDGVLWITSKDTAESLMKTAVYDVRDLCRNEEESNALCEAITSQAAPNSWDDVGGPGSVQFARPGTMVVLNEERILLQVLNLLETYRTALRTSKPRDRNAASDQEVTTVYYRLDAVVAEDLITKLPELIQPDTWQDESHPKSPGKIIRFRSSPEVVDAVAHADKGGDESGAGPAVVIDKVVLRITQTRAVHREIAEMIRRVETGDAILGPGMDGPGAFGGMGGNSFGSGFFSLPTKKPQKAR